MAMTKYTLTDFERQFPSDAACLDWLRDYLYPNGIHCSKCDRVTKHHRVVSRRSYSCDRCGHHVHPTAGTIYHKSPTPLRLWFHAIYRMASTRCGISAKQLQRELGVTYKTAWRMAKQIRSMLNESPGALMGRVEIDDTYVGGKRSGGKTGRGSPGKTVVLGMVERQGPVVAKVVPNLKIKTVLPIIKDTVPSTHTEVFTDELAVYERVHWAGYHHRTIRHGAGVYGIGSVHTNTIEGFWSLVKRGINGVYHSVSPKYLQTYVNEYGFRYNHRHDEKPMFLSFLGQVR
jgi:transposase